VPDRPDLVFTGINKGYNIASGIQYSATVGAALEAANQKIHTIAFSENHIGTHEVTDKYIEQIASELIDTPLGDNEIWNVNFPGCTVEECKGIKYGCTISQESFFTGSYKEIGKEGNKTIYQVDLIPEWKGAEGTDLAAITGNYVSVGKVRNYC
jgi:5'-nucleotidase